MDKISKTLLITTYFPPTIGGAESYLYNVYSRFDASKIFVLAQMQNAKIEKEFDKQQKFKIWRTNFFDSWFKPSWFGLIDKARKIVKQEGIESIHFGHYAHYVLLSQILKMPYVVYFHGTDLANYSRNVWHKVLMKFNLSKARKVIVASNDLKNKVLKIYNQPEKIEVINPGINLDEFKIVESTEEIRQNFNVDLASKVIVSSGHLRKIKGFDLGIEAVAKLVEQGYDIFYYILGGGDELKNLQDLARRLNIFDRVIIKEISDRKEYVKHLKMADLYLGPSRKEGFGIVFLEAQASGLPIVASDVGGIREATKGKAIYFEKNNVQGIVNSILKGFELKTNYNIDESDWNAKLAKFIKVLYN